MFRLARWLVVFVLLALHVPAQNVATAPRAEPLAVRFDLSTARAEGWVAKEASDEEVRSALLAFVRWRLTAAGLEHELVPTASGATLRTPEKDAARARAILAALGPCEFYLLAVEDDAPGGLSAERTRFETWRLAHPDRPLLEYNADPARPAPGIAWLPARYGTESGPARPVVLPRDGSATFGSRDFARVFPTTGSLDYPALGFELRKERTDAFAEFTGKHVKRSLAIVLDSAVRSAPTLNSRLLGSAMIEGKFTDAEVKDLVERLRAPAHAPVVLVESH